MAMNVNFHISMSFYVEELNKYEYSNHPNERSQQEFHVNKKAPVLPEADRYITSSYQKLYLRPSLAP